MRKKWYRATAIVLAAFIFLPFLPKISNIGNPVNAVDIITVSEVKTNGRINPLGLDIGNIYFSWKLESNSRGAEQTAYRIVAASTSAKLAGGEYDLWDTGWISSNEQSVYYDGNALADKTGYYWKVQVKDGSGAESGFSENAYFETGVTDWTADWIGGENIKMMRRSFTLSGNADNISRARAYICGEGLFEFHINGEVVGDYVLTPPVTEYYQRAYYVTYDVQSYLNDGENIVGAILGFGKKNMYYDNIRFLRLEMDIVYKNGDVQKIYTGAGLDWFTNTDSMLTRETYFKGEDIDYNLFNGWDKTGYTQEKALSFGGFNGSLEKTENGFQLSAPHHADLLTNDTYQYFTLEMDAIVLAGSEPALSILFNYTGSNNFFMWQVSHHYARLRPHFYNSGWSVENETNFSSAGITLPVNTKFKFKLDVSESEGVRTYINDILIQAYPSALNITAGKIGFRINPGDKILLENIKLSAGGEALAYGAADWLDAVVYNGNVNITPEGALNLRTSAYLPAVYSNFVFEADVTINQSGGAEDSFGLYFRQNGTTGYMWQLNATLNLIRPHLWVNGSWSLFETVAFTFTMGQSYRFKLVAEGNVFKTYIDGNLKSTVTDTNNTFSSGNIGFRLEAAENNTVDNILVTDTSGSVLFAEDFSAGIDTDIWSVPAYFRPEMTALETFTIIKERIEPVEFHKTADNRYIVDFGQNLSGMVELKVTGARGATVRVNYAELLKQGDPDNINGDTLSGEDLPDEKGSNVYNVYTLRGSGEEVLRPIFTYTGYRYAEVIFTGNITELTADKIVSCFITEDMERTGSFTSSDEVLNGVYNAYLWAQESNTIGLPLASPHREKDGWLGDAHVTSEAVNLIYDAERVYMKWFNDMRDNTYKNNKTYPDGLIRVFLPHTPLGDHSISDVPWQSGRFIILRDLYLATGNKRIITDSYNDMKLTMQYFKSLEESAEPYIILKNSFCDWLGFDNRNGMVSAGMMSTAYYYYSACIFADFAVAVGNNDDGQFYREEASKIKAAINAKYFKNNSYYDFNTQTSNSLALYLGLVPEEYVSSVQDSLINNVIDSNYVSKVGVLGSKSIWEALSAKGRDDLLFKMANNTEYPSLGYMVKNGATTLWEYFEEYGYSIDFPPRYQSQNHNMFGGGYSKWLYSGLAGINNAGTAYDKIIIKPASGICNLSVSAATNTVRGVVSSAFNSQENTYSLNVSIPVNSKAEIHIPLNGRVNAVLTEGADTLYSGGVPSSSTDVKYKSTSGGYLIYEAGSGNYTFMLAGKMTVSETEEKPVPNLTEYTYGNELYTGNITYSEIITSNGTENKWDISGEKIKSLEKDADHLAKINMAPLTANFRISGRFNVSDVTADAWNGLRFIFGYNNPNLFDTIQIQRGAVIFARRTDAVTKGWDNFVAIPYLLRLNKDYNYDLAVLEGKVYFWLDGECIINGADLPSQLTPAFGIYNSQALFEITDISIKPIVTEPVIAGDNFSFNGDVPANITVPISFNAAKFLRLEKDGAVVAVTNYSVSGDGIILNAAYLNTLESGGQLFSAVTDRGNLEFTVIVSVKTKAPVIIGEPDIKITKGAGSIIFSLDTDGKPIQALTLNGNAVSGDLYSYSSGKLTLSKALTDTLKDGKNTFNVVTVGGNVSFTVTVTAEDSCGCGSSSAIPYAAVLLSVLAVVVIKKRK